MEDLQRRPVVGEARKPQVNATNASAGHAEARIHAVAGEVALVADAKAAEDVTVERLEPLPVAGDEVGVNVANRHRASVAEDYTASVAFDLHRLGWYTVMANDRRPKLEQIVSHPDVLIGFSDAGAHLRQMAHYNFPLRMLRLVRQAAERGAPVMSVERAVHRLTGEIADWLAIDAGHLEKGSRADVVVIDPTALGEEVDRAELAPMDFFDGYERLVRRNDAAVRHVFVGGEEAIHHGQPTPSLGARRLGAVLRSSAT